MEGRCFACKGRLADKPSSDAVGGLDPCSTGAGSNFRYNPDRPLAALQERGRGLSGGGEGRGKQAAEVQAGSGRETG